MNTPTIQQKNAAIELDDGSLTTSTVVGATANVPSGSSFRVRALLQEIGAAAITQAYKLQVSVAGAGSWSDVTTGSSPVSIADSTNFTNGTAITAARLSGGTGTFANGAGYDTTGTTDSIALAASGYTEVVFNLNASQDGSWDFRLVDSGGGLLGGGYTVTPTVTVAQFVTGSHIASTASLATPTVAGGPQSVTGEHIASTSAATAAVVDQIAAPVIIARNGGEFSTSPDDVDLEPASVGDLRIFIAYSSNAVSISGWTDVPTGTGFNGYVRVLWRRVEAGDPLTVSVSGVLAAYPWQALVIANAYATAEPIEAIALDFLNDPTAPVPALDPVKWGTESTLWVAGFIARFSTSEPPTPTPPAGYEHQLVTTRFSTTYSSAATSYRRVSAASQAQADYTNGVSTADGGAFRIAVCPAGAASYQPAVTSPTRIASSVAMYVPTVAISTGDEVSGVHIASTEAVNAPTVAVGDVAVTGETIASTETLYEPTTTYEVDGAFVASDETVYEPTVVPGDVSVTGETIASGETTFAADVTQDAVEVTGETIASTEATYVPTLAHLVEGASIAVGSSLTVPEVGYLVEAASIGATDVLNPPTLVETQTVDGATIASAETAYEPTVTTETYVTAEHVASQVSLNVPEIAVGDVEVVAETIASTASVNEPLVSQGDVAVLATHIASTESMFAPEATQNVETATLAAGSTLSSPELAAQIDAAHISSSEALDSPVVSQGSVTILGETIASGESVYAASVAVGDVAVDGVHIASTALVYEVTVEQGIVIEGAHIASTSTLSDPSIAVGDVTVETATIAAASAAYQPIVGAGDIAIDGAHIGSAETTFAGDIAYVVEAGTTTGDGLLFGVEIIVGDVEVIGQTLSSTLVMGAPSVLDASGLRRHAGLTGSPRVHSYTGTDPDDGYSGTMTPKGRYKGG